MKLTSPAFNDGENIPTDYTCDGENISPPLTISGVPEDAKSLALIVYDSDSEGGDFVHWIMWNIDPAVEEIEEGTVPPEASLGANDFNRAGWGGPCPHNKEVHHYHFNLYALSGVLDFAGAVGKVEFRAGIEKVILAETTLIGTYQRF